MAAAWLAFPAVLLLLATGWGLLLEAVAGRALPGALLPGVGFAALVVAVQVPALAPATAPLATPLAVAGAVAGIVIWAGAAGPRAGLSSLRPSAAASAAALGAFALYAAPVVLSGEPAIAGYIRLDDSATFIVVADHALEHGRDTAGFAPSTHELLVRANLAVNYPIGALLPLAVGGKLTGQDLAWLFAPYLAFLAALLALALEVVLVPAIGRRWVRGLVAVAATGSALLFGYALWGGVKELATAALLAIVAAAGTQLPATAPRGLLGRAREVLPLAAACAALLGAVSLAGVVWLGPILLGLGVGLARSRGPREALLALVALVALVAVGSIGPLSDAGFTRALTTTPTEASDRLGNLISPLSPLQALGIWPAGDFRLDPVAVVPTAILLVVLVLAAALGVAQVLGRREWGVLAYAGGVIVGAALVALYSWPWIDAKAYAIASPAPVLLAGVGISAVLETGRWLGGVAVGLALVGGVLWSDALGYHDATLTPHDRHAELARIGERFAGDGPALMTEYDPYGPRWFLRRVDAEGAGELRTRPVPLADGGLLVKAQSADIDAFAYNGLSDYRTLVLRRSPVASRPPSTFQLAWRGHWYDVWRRDPGASPVRVHLGLGMPSDPGGVPPCGEVVGLAQAARPGGALLAAQAPAPVIVGLGEGRLPPGWSAGNPGSGATIPNGGGTVGGTATLPRAGRWSIWLGGAPRTAATVLIDGRSEGGTGPELSYGGQWVPVGVATLSAGPHAIEVRLSGGGLRPGSGSRGVFPVGPVALVESGPRRPMLRVSPGQARRLCGKRLDWVEAVE